MSSDFKIFTSEIFVKSVKKLSKKYSSLPEDLLKFKEFLLLNPTTGISLGKDCYKVRMKITAKQKGKSGGARVVTYVLIVQRKIILLDIYDKSEIETISDKELIYLIRNVNFDV